MLEGNIFATREMQLHPIIYKSLLDTLAMKQKKKHFKKIVEYMQKYEKPQDVSPNLIDHIITIGINQQYPLTLGKFVRDFIVMRDYNIRLDSFIRFFLFIEKCKGFEEDARKFLLITHESSHL